jgi:hypothetical protein
VRLGDLDLLLQIDPSELLTVLNTDLPPDYFAAAQVHAGPRIEIDVATWNEPTASPGSVTTLIRSWPTLSPADLI